MVLAWNPKMVLFAFSRNAFSPQMFISPKPMGSDFVVLVLSHSPCKHSKPKKNASKRLKARRRNISWRWSKTCSKQAKNMIFSKISMQAYISVERIWKILRKPFLQCFTIRCIFSALRVIAEKPPSKAIFNFCGPWWLKAYSQFLLISLKGEHKQSLRVKHKLQFVTLMQI